MLLLVTGHIVQLKYILLISLKIALAGKWDWKGVPFDVTLVAILACLTIYIAVE